MIRVNVFAEIHVNITFSVPMIFNVEVKWFWICMALDKSDFEMEYKNYSGSKSL